MYDLKFKFKANELEITSLRPGLFTNMFVILEDGSRQEIWLQTVSKPVVEEVILLNEDGDKAIMRKPKKSRIRNRR